MERPVTLRTVRLYGSLGSRFGREFKLSVTSPAEAVRALCAMIPGFEVYISNSKRRGEGYGVWAGKRNLREDELQAPSGPDDIRIAPFPLGSKSSWVSIIAGVVLIVVGVVTSWAGGSYLIGMGVSMLISGVAQMLVPQSKPGSGERPENQPSHTFNGPVNTQAQGNPVPLLYGRMITGSAVVSAGIVNEDVVPQAKNGSGVGYTGGNWIAKQAHDVQDRINQIQHDRDTAAWSVQ